MIIHLLPEIDLRIWKKVGNHDAAKKGQQGRHHNAARIPDETILAMRRMHEIERAPLKAVQAAYPWINANYVRNVLNYIARANLRVTK